VAGIIGCLDRPPEAGAPGRLLNIGNERPEPVARLIALLEQALDRDAIIERVPRPATDVEATFADIDAIRVLTGYAPRTRLEDGIPRFVEWFRRHEVAATAA
jgi:UDP-glucuronate 4-epimerase